MNAHAIYARVLAHLLASIRAAPVCAEPFGHTYFEDLFPEDVYAEMLASLPPADWYWTGPTDPGAEAPPRTFYNLTTAAVNRLPVSSRDLWRGVASALTDVELKRCLYAKLAPDLMYRFGAEDGEVPDLPGHPRPSLYRDTAGYELAPHPDTLKKVVTMHLYLPADLSQIELGTSLYRRDPGPPSRATFTEVKRFEFRPNTGYAFAVSNGPSRQSWHGCERLPPDSGVRNTLLNTFYADPRPGYVGYLEGKE